MAGDAPLRVAAPGQRIESEMLQHGVERDANRVTMMTELTTRPHLIPRANGSSHNDKDRDVR